MSEGTTSTWAPEPSDLEHPVMPPVGGRIVVADDDESIRDLVDFLLTQGGATVVQAADGDAALRACRQPGVELAVLDIQMPGMTGLEVLRALKADPGTADLPVLLLTAHSMRGGLAQGLGLGAHDYIRKPFDMDELRARVDSAVLLGRRTRELVASRARYRTLIDLLPGTTVFVLDSDLRIVSASGTALSERDAPPLEGQLLESVAAAEGYAEVLPHFRRALSGEPTGLFPVTSVSGRHWLVDATAIPGEDSGPHLLVTMRDATELMTAQQALRVAEARFHRAFDDAPVGIVITDLAGAWLQVNDAFAKITGYPLDTLQSMRHSDLLAAEDLDAREEVAARGSGASKQTQIWHADGHRVWVTANVAPLHDENGMHVANISHIEDITERKRIEDALLAAEQRFRDAFERAPVGMAQLSVLARVDQANDALADLLGYTCEQLLGRSDDELTFPGDASRSATAIARLVSGEATSCQLEKRYLNANGHPVWVTLSAVSVTDDRGQVLHLLAHYLDITERKKFETQLKHLVDHDPLTGLLNRRGFEVELDRQAARVRRSGPGGALLMLDLDNFKQVNDTLGHNVGDELIMSVADLLRRTIRETDPVARLGGDEFAVILPEANLAEAEIVAAKIVQQVREQVMYLSGNQQRIITASVGVAMFDDHALSGQQVLVNADLTMYDAKDAGRNRYACYSTASHKQPRTKARLDWVDRINHALDHDRFELHAQPVLDLRTGRISHYELLLRMLGDDNKPIRADSFLYIAERAGLMRRIDHWVTGRAIDLLAHPKLPADTVLEVNVSGLSVGDPELLAFLEQRLSATGADPARLVFEITETAAVGNIQAARAFSERLGDIGCRFALDDFGSGFASFYYLKHLPFDFIKIDGEFIANCLSSETDRLVISAIVTIAQGLGKQTIAEFVGDQETLEFLTRQGIDFAQGYYVGKPTGIEGLIDSA